MVLSRRLIAEFLGTALLLAAVVGSGVMGVKLAQGNDAVALLANAAATAGALYVLIVLFGPVSGAHFNPVVTLAMCLRGELTTPEAFAYVAAQVTGAVLGVLLAHTMFGLVPVQPGLHARPGAAQWLSEGVATFGLLLTILLGLRHRPQAIPALVASWIFAAYWFTASTSFANPAVTLARALTQTFAGIRRWTSRRSCSRRWWAGLQRWRRPVWCALRGATHPAPEGAAPAVIDSHAAETPRLQSSPGSGEAHDDVRNLSAHWRAVQPQGRGRLFRCRRRAPGGA